MKAKDVPTGGDRAVNTTPLQPPTSSGRATSPTAFVGTWQLAVEGGSYTTDNYATNTRTVTSSAGALARRLVIRADGTYDWGGTKGQWVTTGNASYPLALRKADHGHDWKVGWDTRRNAAAGHIIVWDGFTYEIGTAVKQ